MRRRKCDRPGIARRGLFSGVMPGDMRLGQLNHDARAFGETEGQVFARWAQGTRRQRQWARSISREYPWLVERWSVGQIARDFLASDPRP
jgi:hypothetical protein